MAVVVEVISTNIPNTAGPVEGVVSITLTGDYEFPARFVTQIDLNIKDAPNQDAAVKQALDMVVTLASQIRAGAMKALEDHPAGA